MSKNQAKMCLMIRDMCIVPPLSLSLSYTDKFWRSFDFRSNRQCPIRKLSASNGVKLIGFLF